METGIQLLVGLGNPGPKYQSNRHNIGFMVMGELARRLGISFQPVDSSYLLARRVLENGHEIHLLKPLTYMNLSGEALVAWAGNENQVLTGASRPLVVCDDLSLPLGSLRLRAAGRSGGQNGLASIIECLGDDTFARMRLGVAGGTGDIPPEIWADYVLADFPSSEAEKANELVNHAVAALEFYLNGGLEKTVSRFNRRIRIED